MKLRIVVIIAVIAIGLVISYNDFINRPKIENKEYTEYLCDYKSLKINTEISTKYNGSDIIISGNILKIVEDPLTAKDSNGNIIGYAGDSYGFIEQDDHGIYIDDKFDINMCGNFELYGNSYDLKDENGEVVATAKFNGSNTGGEIVETSGKIIATYQSNLWSNDYKVYIYDNNICSDLSILMIVASYVSDFKADQ